MSAENTREEKVGKYVYAVVPAQSVDSLKLETKGVGGGEPYPIVAGNLAAIISDIEPEPLRPERKNLAAQSDVLREVMDQAPLLPVAFGIIAGSEREVRELLANHEEDLVEQLREIEGQLEMGLRGRLNVSNLFDYFIETSPELRSMRDEVFSAGEPSREQKIELGKYFADLLERFRAETVEQVQRELASVNSEIRVNPPRTEEEVLNLALLVPKEKLEAFRKAVEELAPKLDENLQLDLTGPWPPYNFVQVRVQLEQVPQEGAEEAR